MLTSYQRRAFLVFVMGAIGSNASSARAASDSLWDVLAKTQLAAQLATAPKVGQTEGPRRRPLGPIPGYTLPAPQKDGLDDDSLFAKTKPRHRGVLGWIGELGDRLGNATGTKIKWSGQSSISARLDSVSGNSASYQSEQYNGQGSNGVYTNANVNMDATFFKYFHYQTSINNSPYHNPNSNTVKLDYKTSSTQAEVGDINAGFSGNTFVDFSRYLAGIKVTDTWSRQLKTSVLYSETKAETRTITVAGNNSSGPYYVYAGQIVEGSDQVRVDNHQLQRGTDYTLDLITGELNFTRGNIILTTQTIAVTFETMGYNQQKGRIYGVRAEYLPTSGSKVGLTYVTQTTAGGSGLQTVTQQFYGHVDPTQPYILDQAIDLTKPLIVSIEGTPLVKNIDYTVNSNLTNQILLKASVPQTQFVQVQYVPLNATINPGNRSVLGLDGSLTLGKIGSLSIESALSGLSVTGNNYQGEAYQIRADLNPLRNVHTNLTLRDISPTFSSIQSPGFNQNEKSIEFSSDYAPTKNLRLNMEWEDAKRPSYSTGTTSSQFTPNYNGNDDYTQYNLGANYNFTKNGVLSLTRSDISTNYAVGGFSKTLSDSLALTYGWKTVTIDTGLSEYTSSSNELYDTSGTTGQQYIGSNSSTFNKRVNVSWKATHWLSLNSSYSDSSINTNSSGSVSATDATDTQIGAQLTPMKKMRITWSYDLSDTGDNGTSNTTTTGTTGTTATGTASRNIFASPFFTSPFFTSPRDITAGGSGSTTTTTTTSGTQLGGGANSGVGTSGNYSGAFGNTTSSGYGYSSFGGKSGTNRFRIDYQPRPAITMGLSYDNSTSYGTYQYNSNRNGFGLNFGYQPSERLAFNTSYNLQRVIYTGGQGATNTNIFQLSFQGRPFGGKLATLLNWQSTITTSSVQFSSSTTSTGTTPTNADTNISSLSARLEYPLNRHETLFVEMDNSTSSGYLASNDNDLKFGMQYSLTRTFGLQLGWQLLSRTNKDTTDAQYNYKVSSLLAQLGFNFN